MSKSSSGSFVRRCVLLGMVIVGGCAKSPVTPETKSPTSTPGPVSSSWDSTAPPFDPQDYWPHQFDLELWPTTAHGLALGAKVAFTQIDCLIDETGKARRVQCQPSIASPTIAAFRQRLGRCFAVSDRNTAADVASLEQHVQRGVQPPSSPGLFQAVRIVRRWLSPEHETMCPDNKPGGPIGSCMRGPPTGRMNVSESSEERIFGPVPGPVLIPPLFEPERRPVAWVNIGRRDRVANRFVEDRSLGMKSGSVPDPATALPLLEQAQVSGPFERKAAILIDRALAAFRLGDLARGRAATSQLRELVARESPMDRRDLLLLRQTQPSLDAAASGSWSLTDPCRP